MATLASTLATRRADAAEGRVAGLVQALADAEERAEVAEAALARERELHVGVVQAAVTHALAAALAQGIGQGP